MHCNSLRAVRHTESASDFAPLSRWDQDSFHPLVSTVARLLSSTLGTELPFSEARIVHCLWLAYFDLVGDTRAAL